MRIDKILNNNVAVILDKEGVETIVMGRGLAFQKRAGDLIDERKVDKVFTLSGKEMNSKFQKLLTDMPLEYIVVSEKIIQLARSSLQKQITDNIYITLTDHIGAAIERYKEGSVLKNALLWDIKQFYPDEFKVALQALDIVNQECETALPEDEAGFIALHFVNAQMSEVDDNMSIVHFMTRFIQDVTGIIRDSCQIEYNADSLEYYRFINHLKFLAQRLYLQKAYMDDDNTLLDIVKKQYRKAFS